MNLLSKKVIWGNPGWMPFYFGFCPTKEAWNDQMGLLQTEAPFPDEVAYCASLTASHGPLIILTIYSPDLIANGTPSEILGAIVHESTHVWQFLNEFIGEENPSYEHEAYGIQNIVQQQIAAVEEFYGVSVSVKPVKKKGKKK
jgi:hypothetical protein